MCVSAACVQAGVGNAPDTYAYDGQRIRRLSVSFDTYGERWSAGDVIGCCIDLNKGACRQ